jgi:hypothetical protein
MGNRVGLMGMQQAHNPVIGTNNISKESEIALLQQQMHSMDPTGLQQRRQTEQPNHSPVMMRGSPYNEFGPQNSPGRARVNSLNANPERPKMIASNLPTSVLRQLSAKSSDSPGRSTSPNVNKQLPSYSPTQPRSMQASPSTLWRLQLYANVSARASRRWWLSWISDGNGWTKHDYGTVDANAK